MVAPMVELAADKREATSAASATSAAWAGRQVAAWAAALVVAWGASTCLASFGVDPSVEVALLHPSPI